MSTWPEAFVFGAMLVAFVLGLTSIIMSFFKLPVGPEESVKRKTEYGFFGIAGIVISMVLAYAI